MHMSASAARTPIDFDHLKLYTGGDVALTREVLQLFRTQCAQILETLQGAGNSRAAKESAHGIKGACRSIGAWEAAQLAEVVEQSLNASASDRENAVAALAENLTKVWAAALAYEQGS
jgi:HPt (histidine-containing phosphotransfer) domain-containing protein